MADRLKDIDTTAFHSQSNRHPLISIPPNLATFYTAAAAGNTLVVGTALSLSARGWGGASTAHLIVAGTLGSGKAVTFQLVGRDENWNRVEEALTVVGDGATTSWNIVSKNLYSEVISFTPTNIVGSLIAGETFSLGIGNGTATPRIRIPNPIVGLVPLTQFLGVTIVNSTTFIAPVSPATAVSPSPSQVIFDYASNAQSRLAFPVFAGIDRSVYDRA